MTNSTVRQKNNTLLYKRYSLEYTINERLILSDYHIKVCLFLCFTYSHVLDNLGLNAR